MKTAISVPDATFVRATRRARELGMSRSEFFSRAAARYLDELDGDGITQRIDEAIVASGSVDGSASDAVASGKWALLGDDAENW